MNKQKEEQSLVGTALSVIGSILALAFIFVGEKLWDYFLGYGGVAYIFPLIGGGLIWWIADKFIKPDLSIEELRFVTIQGSLAFYFIISVLIVANDVSLDGLFIATGLVFFIWKRSTLFPLILLCIYNLYLFVINITRIIEYSWNSPESKGLWAILLLTAVSLISAYIVFEGRKEQEESSPSTDSKKKSSKALGVFIAFTAVGIVGWVGWNDYQKRLPDKVIENLFSYAEKKECEQVFDQYLTEIFALSGVSPEEFKSSCEACSNYKIFSVDSFTDHGLIRANISQYNTLKTLSQDLSFLDYKNKRLFIVKYYRENLKEDTKLYRESQRFCSTPGINVTSYFGMVQVDAFTWKILLYYPYSLECAGKNKYAEYKAQEEQKIIKTKLNASCLSFYATNSKSNLLIDGRTTECRCMANTVYAYLDKWQKSSLLTSDASSTQWKELIKGRPKYYFKKCKPTYSYPMPSWMKEYYNN